MITKAIIVDKKDNLYKVRIPILHGVDGAANWTVDDDLPYASVCAFGNYINPLSSGDIVFVTFEENDASKPIILGLLYLEKELDTKILANIQSDLYVRNITVLGKAQLSNNVIIEDAKNINFEHLTNTEENIHEQLKEIKERLAKLES